MRPSLPAWTPPTGRAAGQPATRSRGASPRHSSGTGGEGGAQSRVLLGQPGVIIVIFPPLPVLPRVHGKVQRQQLVLRIRQGDHSWNTKERDLYQIAQGGSGGSKPL